MSLIDDQNFPARWNPQSFFDHLRKNTATTYRRVEAKFASTINVPLFQATVLLSNTESHNLDWFPDISGDIADKLLLIKTSKADLPTGESHRAKIRKELDQGRAAWRYHLKHEYVPPAEILDEGRYGIKSFHHPELCDDNYAARQRQDFIAAVNLLTRESQGHEFEGDSFALKIAFAECGLPGLVKWAEQNIKTTAVLGKLIVAAQKEIPDQVFIFADRPNHCNRFRLLSPEKAEAIKRGAETPEAKARIIEAKIPNQQKIKVEAP